MSARTPRDAPPDSVPDVEDARLEELCAAAFIAMRNGYAPYSSFRVGAALLARDGRVFVGCNVETAASPSGLCAERGALAAAVAHGAREFDLVVVASEAETPSPPCGLCRQALVEFAPTLGVVSCTAGGAQARWSLAELLPHPFTPHSLDKS
jgi:cytidine deaminase